MAISTEHHISELFCAADLCRPTSPRQQHSSGPGQGPDLGERSQHRAVLVVQGAWELRCLQLHRHLQWDQVPNWLPSFHCLIKVSSFHFFLSFFHCLISFFKFLFVVYKVVSVTLAPSKIYILSLLKSVGYRVLYLLWCPLQIKYASVFFCNFRVCRYQPWDMKKMREYTSVTMAHNTFCCHHVVSVGF
jgi:hypothetical protein